MPSINTTSNMVVRKEVGRSRSVSISPCRKSAMLCLVVGTSSRLKSSFAAWTLQAKTHGDVANSWKDSGDGATVETVTL
jgi:hypothetical protein